MGIHHPILPNFVYFEFATIKGFLKIIWKAITDKSEDTELVFCKSFQELRSELSVVSEQICNGNSSDDILQVLEIPFQALEISWNHTINEFSFNKSITWLKGKVEKIKDVDYGATVVNSELRQTRRRKGTADDLTFHLGIWNPQRKSPCMWMGFARRAKNV